MRWTEVTICTTTDGADAMAQVLFSMGVDGVSIEDPADIALCQRQGGDWDYIDEKLLADRGANVYVKGYFPSEHQQDKVQTIRDKVALIVSMENDGLNFGSGEIDVHLIEDEDWSQNWKKYYKPFAVGETLAVTPCWEPYASPGRVVVRLDPGAAFGTGQHETTFMCLFMAEHAVQTGDCVLDIGCGTGILGIASIALGASHATLIDRDETALDAARHNVDLNNVAQLVDILRGDLAHGVNGPYEIVFANIVADAVIALMPDVKRLITTQGAFIASGIIAQREQDVIVAAERNGLLVEERMRRGEWIALLLRPTS